MIRFSISFDNRSKKEIDNLDKDFLQGFTLGFQKAILIAEAGAKKRSPVLTGHLRRSIRSGAKIDIRKASGWVGSDVIYACVFDALTRVTTDSGTKIIGKVVVGDKVLTQTGEFKEVIHKTKFPATEKPNLVKITTEWRSDRKHSVTVTEDHKILVYRDGRNKWITAGDLKLTDKLFDRKKKSHNKDKGIRKICVNCNKIFKPHQSKNFLCSNKCKLEWWNKGNNPHIGMKRTDETKDNLRKALLKRMEEHPELHPNFIMAQKGHKTSIEKQVEDVLIHDNETYFYQYSVGKYYVDFYLPERNLIIEADGGYWHQNQDKDIQRDKNIMKKIPGVKILHIHFYDEGYSPTDIEPNPIENTIYSVCNPNINSYVDLDTFRMVKILNIEKFTYEQTPGHRSAYLYDLSIDGVHSFLANGIIVSNSIQEEGGIIRPKRYKYLKFQIRGQWRSVKQVYIKGKHYLERGMVENLARIKDVIRNEIVKSMNKGK